MKFRPYQHAAAQAVIDHHAMVRSTLVQASVGTGKTVIFSLLAKRLFPRRVLVVAHRKELIDQARDKIERFTGIKAEIEMAEQRATTNLPKHQLPRVVVATIQTLTTGGDGGRITRFHPTDFDLVVIDECHRGLSPTYRRLFDYFGLNPNCRFVGFTATPDRTDGKALGEIFDSVAFRYPMLNAISDGWLVPVQQQMAHVASIDLSNIRTKGGDLDPTQLAEVLEHERPLLEMADPIVQLGGDDRRGIIFTASVEQAERLCEIINRYRPGRAAWLHAGTPKPERELIRKQFENGDIQYVANMGIWTEGFDDDGVRDIYMCRPTKSRSLYEQMCGRGVRPHDGIAGQLGDIEYAEDRRALIAASPKPDCRIIDFVMNSGRHKLVTTLDILGGDASDAAKAKVAKKLRESGRAIEVAPLLEEEEKRIREEREKRRLAAEAKRKALQAKVEYELEDVDPFDSLGIRHAPPQYGPPKMLKDTHRDLLLRNGLNPEKMTYNEASALCREIIKRYKTGQCSYKQARVLSRYGYDPHCSREAASRILDSIAIEKGWTKKEEKA